MKNGEYCRTFPLTPETIVDVTENFAALPEIISTNIAIGRFEIARQGNTLRLRGHVVDGKISQCELPWMSSSIELFFVVNNQVEQYFLLPADGANPDQVSKMPHFAPVSNVDFQTFPHPDGGYGCEISLPPEVTGIDGGCIRMEMSVNAHNRFGFMRGQLFGIDNRRRVESFNGRLLLGV